MSILNKTFDQLKEERKQQILSGIRYKKGPLPTECWIWRTPRAQGYGVLARGKYVYTHRLAYELFVGPIPAGMYMNHICDTKACCNPQHLYPGTPEQNREDYIKRQRARQAQELLGWDEERRYWFEINEAMRQEELRH